MDFFEDDSLPVEKRKEFISIMRKSSDRLIETVTSIIELSKLEKGMIEIKKEKFNVCNELNNLVFDTQNKLLKPEVEFIWEFDEHLKNQVVETDKLNLVLILKHLISNAIKFTEKGHVKFRANKNKKDLVISIEDTGIGIPENELDTIFKPFRKSEDTIQKAIDGNGLGLTLAQKLANTMGGEIKVSSQLEKGSRFTLSLPNIFVDEPVQKNNLLSEKILRNKTVLIAEDELSNFMFLEAVLQKLGCNVLHAKNGEEAIHCGLNGQKIDLILMDLKMPVMDGFTATKKIREANQEVPIIAHSAFVLNNEQELAREAGCNDYLPKPVKPAELIKVLQKHIAESMQ